MIKRSWSVFLLAVIFSSSGWAQQGPWTLDACVQYALDHNLQILQSENQVDIQENNADAAMANLWPNLNAGANYNFNFGLNIDPVTNQISQDTRQTNTLSLTTSWTLFDGTSNYKTLTQARLNKMAALYDLKAMRNDVALNVASQYLQALLNKELLQVAEDQKAVTERQVRRMELLVEAGSRPQGDLYDLQAQLARDEQSVVSARNNYTLAILTLAQTLQLDSAEGFEIAEPTGELPGTELIVMGPDAIYNASLEKQPQIKAAETRVESAEKGVGISAAQYYPSLSLQAGISTSYSDQIPNSVGSQVVTYPIGQTAGGEQVFATGMFPVYDGSIKPFGDQYRDNLNEFIGFNLQIPIYNRLQVRNSVRNAKISLENSQLSLQNEKNTLRQTIQRAHADALASYENYRAAERSVSAAEESFKYATARYENGALNQFDYENSRNSLTQAKSQLLRNKYDFTFRVKVLEFYLSNPLEQ